MGLAERFKDKLEKKDIFKRSEENYTFKPITQSITVQPKILHSGEISQVETLAELPQVEVAKFEDLETEIIDKIRKTPYWDEFSKSRQEKMISAYFDKRINSGSYSYISHSNNDKTGFVENILALANNR